MNNKIGLFIKRLREEKNWTQENLANQMCYSREAVSKWERGRCEPDIEVLKKLSKLFDVQIEELIAGERNPKDSVVVNLYTKNNKIKKKLKIVITIFITIGILFLLSMSISYYVKENRAIRLYTMYGVGKSYNVTNGLITNTKKRICIKLELFSNYGSGNFNTDIVKMELYYKKDNKDILLNTHYVNHTFIIDKENNTQIMDFKNLDNNINNFYIKLYLENNIIEDIHLNIEYAIINDSIIYK